MITGAGRELGRAFAEEAVKNGDMVIATVRKVNDADPLMKNENVLPVIMDAVKTALDEIAEKVFYKLTDESRPIINVTQWCKRAGCWDQVQAMNVKLPEDLEECLLSQEEGKNQIRIAKKEQKVVKGINAQTEVIKYPADHWKRLAEFAVAHHLVSSTDVSALKAACQLPNKIPNSVQAQHLLKLESRAREEGFKSED